MTTRAFLLFVAAATLPSHAFGQAWVGVRNTFTGSLSYQFTTSNGLTEKTPSGLPITVKDIPIVNHNLFLGLDYVAYDRLAIAATLPIIATKYTGYDPKAVPPNPATTPHGGNDDGELHTFAQDFKLEARYMVLDNPFAFTPFVAATLPSTNYPTRGFAGTGRHLKKAHFGTYLGATLAPFVPNLFVHGRAEFALVERVDVDETTKAINQNTIDASLQIGYFIIESLQVNLAGELHNTLGGINFADAGVWTPAQAKLHDSLLNEDMIFAGGGASWRPTEALSIDLVTRVYVTGINTRNSTLVGLGLSWEINSLWDETYGDDLGDLSQPEG